jgi:hypothetical protein
MSPGKSLQAAAFMTCVLEVAGSGPDSDIGYAKHRLCSETAGLYGNIDSRPLRSRSAPVHYSRIILPLTLHVDVSRHRHEVNNKLIPYDLHSSRHYLSLCVNNVFLCMAWSPELQKTPCSCIYVFWKESEGNSVVRYPNLFVVLCVVYFLYCEYWCFSVRCQTAG